MEDRISKVVLYAAGSDSNGQVQSARSQMGVPATSLASTATRTVLLGITPGEEHAYGWGWVLYWLALRPTHELCGRKSVVTATSEGMSMQMA